MCGRYQLYKSSRELGDLFKTVNPLPNVPPSWNVAPTNDAPVVRRHPESGARHLDMLRWGLVPRWAKDSSGAARMINARSESVATTAAYRDAFARRRCLVPADGFYEWRAGEGPKAPKQPYAIALRDRGTLAFAGLWEGWRSPEGEVLRSFTILTTAANEPLRVLHERMPVILPPEFWPLWLGEEPAEPEALLALLRPLPAEALTVWPVSRRVGNVRENDAALLERDPSVPPLAGLDG